MDEERMAIFLDYENLAIGARDQLGAPFDIKPVSDALAERGRTVVRRAYADWSSFDDDRKMLTRAHVELIDIPQRVGAGGRKNAADIKLSVDAIELSFERDYVSTFVIGTGDSDFTPLVDKLRALNKRVIGIGVEASTSDLLPGACDEFLFYDRLEGVRPVTKPNGRRRGGSRRSAAPKASTPKRTEEDELGVSITQTLSGLKRRSSDTVLASHLKRTLLRKDPTFDEAEYGFRSFTELLRHLEDLRVLSLSDGPAKGDPEVDFPQGVSGEESAFELLRKVVASIQQRSGPPPLSGLKDHLRKQEPSFTEKRFGFGGFLQFCKAARARGVIEMDWDDEADDYLLRATTAPQSS